MPVAFAKACTDGPSSFSGCTVLVRNQSRALSRAAARDLGIEFTSPGVLSMKFLTNRTDGSLVASVNNSVSWLRRKLIAASTIELFFFGGMEPRGNGTQASLATD